MLSGLQERSREEGFTLIELLVVMIIISILMAIAIPTFLGQKENAKATSAKANIKSVQDAIEACAAADPSGSYQGGTPPCWQLASVTALEPGLKSAITGSGGSCAIATASACVTQTASADRDSYTITAVASTSGGNTTFVLTKNGTGVTKTCTGSKKVCHGTW